MEIFWTNRNPPPSGRRASVRSSASTSIASTRDARRREDQRAVGRAHTRDIAFLTFPGFQMLDLSGPLAAFELAGSIDGERPYKIHVVSQGGGTVKSSSGLEVVTHPIRRKNYDTFIVVGGGSSMVTSEMTSGLSTTVARHGRSGTPYRGGFHSRWRGPPQRSACDDTLEVHGAAAAHVSACEGESRLDLYERRGYLDLGRDHCRN